MDVSVKLTANFERNLETIAGFLDKLDAQEAYDRLLDELNDTLIPNLERFPPLAAGCVGQPYHHRRSFPRRGLE